MYKSGRGVCIPRLSQSLARVEADAGVSPFDWLRMPHLSGLLAPCHASSLIGQNPCGRGYCHKMRVCGVDQAGTFEAQPVGTRHLPVTINLEV